MNGTVVVLTTEWQPLFCAEQERLLGNVVVPQMGRNQI